MDRHVGRVADVGEVPRLLTRAEDPEGRPFQEGANEAVEGHVRTLSGPVDGEIAQRDGVDAEILPVQPAEPLGGQFRHTVGRQGKRQGILAERQFLVLTVDGG